MEDRHNKFLEEEKLEHKRMDDEFKIPFEYDAIDEDIVKYFIFGKGANIKA